MKLNKETLQDLSVAEARNVQGGIAATGINGAYLGTCACTGIVQVSCVCDLEHLQQGGIRGNDGHTCPGHGC